MIRILYCKKDNSGLALLMVMATILILETTCLLLYNSKSTSATITNNRILQLKALYCAEAGIAHELWRIQEDPNWRSKPAEHMLGDGSYTISFSEDEAQKEIVITSNALVQGSESTARRTVHYLTIQLDASGDFAGEDTYIEMDHAGDNRDADDKLVLSSEKFKEDNTLVRFPIDKYPLPPPASVHIIASSFSLYLFDMHNNTNNDIFQLYRVTNDWDDGIATWLIRDDAHSWDTFGGDYDHNEVIDSRTLDENAIEGEWQTWRIAPLIRDWIKNPSANYGLIIARKAVIADGKKFYFYNSHYDASPNLAPRLTIYYLDERSP
ncbi:MAG: DNRLRE domain-containing protein [bacterium]